MVIDGVHLGAAAAVEEIVALRVRHQLQLTCETQAVHWLKALGRKRLQLDKI